MAELHQDVVELEPLNTESTAGPKPTFKEKVKGCCSYITVEPAAFLMLTASVLASITTQTLGIEKACRVNLNYSAEVCDSVRNQDSDNNTIYEQTIQQFIAVHLIWKSAITSLIPAVIFVFAGGWMDLTGRRVVLMIYPIAGEILQDLNNMLNVYFFTELPVEVLYFTDAFFGSIGGGWSIMFLAIFSYIADITTVENRTHRLGLVNFFTFAGLPVGLALSGIILKSFGYYAIYGSAMTLHCINLMYVVFRLSDPARTEVQKMHDGQGFLYFLKTFFDPAHIKDTFAVMLKKTKDNRRTKLLIMLMTVCFLFGPMYGEVSILYLSTRYRFNWDEVQFSVFQTYNFILHTIGTIFSIMVFSKYLQWHDSVMGLISSTVKICSAFVFGFAPNATIFYIAPVVDLLGGTGILALRSIFTKTVEPHELGKINSMVGLTENLMPLLYVPLYTQVYSATMEVLPGAVFLMSAAMTIPAVAVFIWLLVSHRRGLKQRDKQSKTEMDSL